MSTKVTTELVKELRDSTGVSVMQCRNALIEAEGDIEKALLVLKKKSNDIALKKTDRITADGLTVVVNGDKKTILLVLRCETDFVAKNEDFVKLANDLAQKALTNGVEKMTIESSETINTAIQKCGEKIELGPIHEIIGDTIGSYVHNNKNAVVVSLTGGTEKLAKDIAMHIVAMKPVYTIKEEIPKDVRNRVTEMFTKEVVGLDKPEEIKQKILAGKIDTYFKEQTLMEQSFIKDSNVNINTLLANNKAILVKFVHESIK